GDISAYIPTNVISITDGQIFLQSDLFFSGVRPAINAGLSVSRVGGDAQIKAMKKVAGTLRLDLAAFRELEAFAQCGSDLDASTLAKLSRCARTLLVLFAGPLELLVVDKQDVILYALVPCFFDDVPFDAVVRFESAFHTGLDPNEKEILNIFRKTEQSQD